MGRLADRLTKPLLVFIVMTGIAAIYLLVQKPLFRLISSQLSDLPFWLPATVMFVPLAVISGSLPLLTRHFVRNINQAGIYMSRTLLAMSTGAISAILLSVYLLVPQFGISSMFITGALALAGSAAIALPMHLKNSPVQLPLPTKTTSGYSSIKFKKKRISLETGAKLTRALLYGSVFQAFAFSSMLIIYIRLLIRYNQLNPLYFHTTLFCVVFAGVAAGSALYRIIADKPNNKYLTLAILQIIAGMASLVSLALLQLFAQNISENIHNTDPYAVIVSRHILLNLLLTFIPSVIHGMSMPLAGRLYPKRLQNIGKTFGKLGSLIFNGLLAGIVLTTLFIIPIIGIHASYFVLSAFILLSGIYLTIRDSRLIRGFRFTFAFSSLLLFILTLVVVRMLNIGVRNRVSVGIYEGSTASVYYTIDSNSVKSVYINGDYYFGTSEKSLKEQKLSAFIPYLLRPQIRKALLIGFNTGITASVLDYLSDPVINISEISPELVRLSSAAFSFENNDILTESSVSIHIKDPRIHLMRSNEKYDLIYSGSEQFKLYPFRYTMDFLKICRQKLSDSGLYCQVLPLKDMDSSEFITIYKSCAAVFRHIKLWYVGNGQVFITASELDNTPDFCRLSKYFQLSGINPLKRTGIDSPEKLFAHFLFEGDPFPERLLPENSDSRPSLFLSHRRNMTPENIKKFLSEYYNPAGCFSASTDCNINKVEIMERISDVNRLLLLGVFPSSTGIQHADSSASKDLPVRQYP